MRQRRCHRGDRHLDLAGDEGGEDGRVALIWNRLDVNAGRGLEHLHGQVERVAGAGHAVIEAAGILLRQRDQLREEVADSFGLAASTSSDATSCVTGIKSRTTSKGSER